MNSEPSYVVIAIAGGDGDSNCDIGHRIWSQHFNSRVAAENATAFIKLSKLRVRLIEDAVGKTIPESVPPAAN